MAEGIFTCQTNLLRHNVCKLCELDCLLLFDADAGVLGEEHFLSGREAVAVSDLVSV